MIQRPKKARTSQLYRNLFLAYHDLPRAARGGECASKKKLKCKESDAGDEERFGIGPREEKRGLSRLKPNTRINAITVLFVIVVLPAVMIGIPIVMLLGTGDKGTKKSPTYNISGMDWYYHELAKNTTSLGQPLVPEVLPVDIDTPSHVKSFTSSVGETWKLVFSDEFNRDGRSFFPGHDKVWEAQELWYWATENLEYLDPEQITTKNGSLVVRLDNEATKPGLNYTSGMITSWNKLCFQGGYLEVNVSFPSPGDAVGYWPAVWTLGNLARPGYGASTDGTWPYSYNTCDEGVLVNQTNRFLSALSGQRLNACVCKGDHPSPGIGRGAPEIDIFEATVHDGYPVLSMSNQVAPFDYHYKSKTEFNTYYNPGKNTPGTTMKNDYVGSVYQQCSSALHYISPSVSGGRKFQTFGIEYRSGPDGYIVWYSDGTPVWRFDARSVGPNPLSKIGQRVVPEEPMVSIRLFASGYVYVYVRSFDLVYMRGAVQM
ncbi:putative beta-glucan synthesis-associated protein [Zancudomyces culisetae]|uniref:Putative beta-glucan synthesis-associated protein n=1 Tax=Zancudomyces culisetae TaxID=1213189 RepID=A0A1R1PG14_ZANCU|nr:putative beta-glucan synthesis-associated protein [Zancudomyces culisetae]|eukprot:OMH79869.1 putative beta-glucan synthesis-associated protein [Zancudomyces culisetae]